MYLISLLLLLFMLEVLEITFPLFDQFKLIQLQSLEFECKYGKSMTSDSPKKPT